MLAISWSWLVGLLLLQLLLWAIFWPIASIALVLTFLVARRLRRGRMAALAATAIGFGMFSGIVVVGLVGAGRTTTLSEDVAVLTGYFTFTFLPIAYLTSRIAVRSGLEADSGVGLNLAREASSLGATEVSPGGPWRAGPPSRRLSGPTDR